MGSVMGSNGSVRHLGGRVAGGALMVVAAIVVSLTGLVSHARPVHAAANCGLVVQIIAAPYAVVDSNKPGIEGPQVATVGARITNAGGIPVSDVSVRLDSASLGLRNGSPAAHFLNDLAPGASVAAYWPVTYAPTFGTSHGYTVSANSPAGCGAVGASQLTTQSQISATANKLQPSGASLAVTPAMVTPGSLVTVRVTGFTLGTVGQGPHGAHDAWLQPIGNLDFDPSCLRLVRSEVRIGSLRPTPFVDQLYFTGLNNYRSSPSDYVAYTFIALRACTTAVRPYQEAASGTQQKYNTDYSASTSSVALASAGLSSLVITIQPDRATVEANDPVHYTVEFSAPDAPVGYPSNGNPVVITADIPDETSYVAGSATTAAPAEVQYSSDQGATWSSQEPADPTSVTDLRWVVDTQVDATPLQAQFQVVVDSTYAGAPLVASAAGSLGDGSVLSESTATMTAPPPNNPPSAVDDRMLVARDAATELTPAANDVDVDGNLNLASLAVTTPPAHGSLVSNGDGRLTYTPAPGYTGPDSFGYRICDGANACDEATALLFVGWEQLRWETATTLVAFEDLKNVGWSDWDYNDFVVRVEIRQGFDAANQLAGVEIDYAALARGAGYYQRFVHGLPIQGGGTALLTVRDGAGNVVVERHDTFTTDTDFIIFDRTANVLPPLPGFFDTNTRNGQASVVAGGTAKLTVFVNSPAANPAVAMPPPPWDPYIYVYNTQQEVHLLIPGHLDNTQTVNPARDPASPLVGYDLPLAQTFAPGWRWPEEFRGMWRAYPQFVDHVGAGSAQALGWWRPENAMPDWLWSLGAESPVLGSAMEEVAAKSRFFARPTIADLNGDGRMEVIVGDLLANQVLVVDAFQRPVAGWPQPVGGGVKAAAAAVDLDGDGLLEVLLGAADGKLYAWHHDGRPVAGWPVVVSALRILATPAIGDLDGNDELDIVVPAADGKLYAFTAAGAPKAGWPVSIGDVADLYGSQVVNSSPRVADLDGDGTREIVVGSTDKRVYAFNGDGTLRWVYQTGDMVLSTPAVADIDPATPGLETVVGSGDSAVYLLDAAGGLLWRRATGWTVRSSPALGDLDGDSDVEIVIGADDDKVWAWHHTGDLVAGWPKPTGADVFASPSIGDVDGDGRPDVVVGSDDAHVHAWHGDGSPLAGWPQAAALSVKGGPALANLDDDPGLEVVAGDLKGVLHLWNVDGMPDQQLFFPLLARQQ